MERFVISSNRRDTHGEVMLKQALENMAIQVNGENKMAFIMNHRRDLPPLGIFLDGRIEEEDDLALLTAAPMRFSKREVVNIDGTDFIKERFDEEYKIVSRFDNKATELSVSLDTSNFSSDQEFEALNRDIYELDKKVELEMHGRKSEFPAPEVIISVLVLSPIGKFILEKIAEDILEDVYKEAKKKLKIFANYAAQVMKLTRQKAVPKNKRLTTIFEIHSTPFIELVVRTDDPAIISKSLNDDRLKAVGVEIQKFKSLFSVDCIQFVASDKGHWKFNYLITTKGDVIGQKPSFDERDKQFARYEMQSKELAAHKFNKPLLPRNKKIIPTF